MAVPVRSRARGVLLPSACATLLALVAAGTLTRGPAAGLAIAGLLAVLTGVLAVAAGGARWAHIGSRRMAAAVAAVGVVAFLAGAVVESRTAAVTEASPVSADQPARG